MPCNGNLPKNFSRRLIVEFNFIQIPALLFQERTSFCEGEWMHSVRPSNHPEQSVSGVEYSRQYNQPWPSLREGEYKSAISMIQNHHTKINAAISAINCNISSKVYEGADTSAAAKQFPITSIISTTIWQQITSAAATQRGCTSTAIPNSHSNRSHHWHFHQTKVVLNDQQYFGFRGRSNLQVQTFSIDCCKASNFGFRGRAMLSGNCRFESSVPVDC